MSNSNKKIGIIVAIISMIALMSLVSASTNINSCQVLNKTGETYILTSDVSTGGACFVIQASDITLNCNGHFITGIDDRGYGLYGIYAELQMPPTAYNNLKINDCIITNFDINVNLENIQNLVMRNSDLSSYIRSPFELTTWSYNASVHNTIYNETDEHIAGSSLKRYFYLDVTTLDSSNPLENISIVIKDIFNRTIFSGLTNMNGKIPQQELMSYEVLFNINDYDIKNYSSPYTISVSGGGMYKEETIIVNLNESKNLIFDLEVNENLSSVTVDKKTLELGESAIFTINLTSDLSDLNFSDGFYSEHYVGWVFTNENGDVIESKPFEKINNTYLEIKTITPISAGNYSLMAFIIEYNQSYNKQTEEWITSPEVIKIQRGETISVTNPPIPEIPIPSPPTISIPNIMTWFLGILQIIWDWFKSLF